MPQSLVRVHIHLVFGTKYRLQLISDEVRASLHCCIADVLNSIGCYPKIINSVGDHVHILFTLARAEALSHVVELTKKTSSKWMKTQGAEFTGFSWQRGYGAFSVSDRAVPIVRTYIARQRERHAVQRRTTS